MILIGMNQVRGIRHGVLDTCILNLFKCIYNVNDTPCNNTCVSMLINVITNTTFEEIKDRMCRYTGSKSPNKC